MLCSRKQLPFSLSVLFKSRDLQDILNDIDDITEEKEESVDLFGKIKAETPFVKDTTATLSNSKQAVTDNFKENKDYEYTVIGCSTLVESNIKCGGSIKVEGTDAHVVVLAYSLAVFSVVEIIVADGGIGTVNVFRRRTFGDVFNKSVDALAVAAFVFAERDIEVGAISHIARDRQSFQMRQLIDSSGIVAIVVHCQSS